jgi:hypothetical protein
MGEDTVIMKGGMRVVSDDESTPEEEAATQPTKEFRPWSGKWTWPQALEADRSEKAEQLAVQQEFGWMKEADHCLMGHGPHPVTLERFISNAEGSVDLHFKAIECRKPPEDQGVSTEDTYMELDGFHGPQAGRLGVGADGCVRTFAQSAVQGSSEREAHGLGLANGGGSGGGESARVYHCSGIGHHDLLPAHELEAVDGHVEESRILDDRGRVRRRGRRIRLPELPYGGKS